LIWAHKRNKSSEWHDDFLMLPYARFERQPTQEKKRNPPRLPLADELEQSVWSQRAEGNEIQHFV
jgi:hypothetical protein